MADIGFVEQKYEKPLLDAESADIRSDWEVVVQPDGLLYPTDKILNDKGGGRLDLYRKIYSDPQIKSLYQQRIDRRLAFKVQVKPGGTKQADLDAAEWVQDSLLRHLRFDEIDKKMSLAIHYGYSVAELMLTRDGDKVTLDFSKGGIRVRRRGRFRFDADGGTRILTRNNTISGEIFPPSRLWKIECGAEDDDDPYGQGLGHWLYWAHFCKHGGMPLWLNYLDGSATGVPLVTHGANIGPAEKDAALKLARDIKNGRPSRKSEGFIVELLQATNSGTADYATLIGLCDAWFSKVIMSQTMTTDNGSSNSQAQVHDRVAESVVSSDDDLVCGTFSRQVITPLCAWNFPGAMPPKITRIAEETEDLLARSEQASKMYTLGYRIAPETVNRLYGEGEYLDLQDPNLAKVASLNGEQAKALIEIVSLSANLAPEASKAIAKAAFPQLPDELVNKIFSTPSPQKITPPDTQVPSQVSSQPQPPNNAPKATFSEIRSGEIYDFAEKAKNDTVEAIADRLRPALGKHLEEWNQRLQNAYSECSTFDELQERLAAIYEGMNASREKLVKEAALGFRLSYLAGISEAEDGSS